MTRHFLEVNVSEKLYTINCVYQSILILILVTRDRAVMSSLLVLTRRRMRADGASVALLALLVAVALATAVRAEEVETEQQQTEAHGVEVASDMEPLAAPATMTMVWSLSCTRWRILWLC